MSPRVWSVLALALAPACSSTARVLPQSVVSAGHPPAVVHGDLRIEARYYVDQARIFGGDLTVEDRLLPIALRTGRAPLAPPGLALAADPQLALHLADGTSLRPVPLASTGVRRRTLERLLAESFDGRALEPWDDAEEGFVYFALPAGLHLDSASLRVVASGPAGARSLDLHASLLTFEVVDARGPRTVAVGLAFDRRGARGE